MAVGLSIVVLAVIALSVVYYFAYQQQTTPKPPPEPIPSQSNFYLGNSRIFVVSANASYGNYPFPTHTALNGSVIDYGEPCVIINVTIRNDYSAEFPPPSPNQIINSTVAYVYLTADLFSGAKEVSATDLLLFGEPPSGGAVAWMSSGQESSLTLYLATNNKDVTSFQIIPRYITGIPLP